MTREEWLEKAVENLGPWFDRAGYTLPKVRVSVGWPKGARKATIGQCFKSACAKDGTPQIFISPVLEEVTSPYGVLPTLVHELLHACDDCVSGHGAGFKRGMKALGLEGKATSTHAGEELLAMLKEIAQELGQYPHSELNVSEQIKKQKTRLLKVSCDACGYVCRVTAKWIEAQGTPICPCNHEPMGEWNKEGGEDD